jgi:sulfite reductase beta subunit-like hemoprotein
MQRLKALGGVLDARQWRTLADIVRQETPDTPLHLTTRQDVEIHNLPADRVPDVQRALDDAGLTTQGACGDTLRNVVVCPCSGTKPDSVDLVPLAWQIRHRLEAEPGILSLPRKFKIALACGPDCGQPWIQDLGLVAERRSGVWGFRVCAAGSLGAHPGTGFGLFEWIPASDVLPLSVGLVRVFAEHGDRTNRRRARLRHVRERLGDEALFALARDALDTARSGEEWPGPCLPEVTDPFPASARLTFLNGDVSANALDALAALAGDDALCVRIGTLHQICIFARDEAALRAALDGRPALSDAAAPQPAIVACPGNRWCSRGLVDTNTLASRIRSELGDRVRSGATVCISGCPNGCSHAAVADIGLVGGVTRVDNERRDAYRLLAGGDMGRGPRLAEPVAEKLLPDAAIAAIAELLEDGE